MNYEEKPTSQKVDAFLGLQGGAVTPFTIAIATWLIVFFVTLSIAFTVSEFWVAMIGAEFKISAVIGSLAMGLVWWGELGQRRRSIANSFIQLVEVATKTDINGGGIGLSPAPMVIHKYIVTFNGGHSQNRHRLKWESGKLYLIEGVARRSLDGIPFSESNYISGNNKMLTPSQFKSLKSQWLGSSEKVLQKTDPRINSAVQFTERGIRLLRHIVGESPEDEIVEGEVVE